MTDALAGHIPPARASTPDPRCPEESRRTKRHVLDSNHRSLCSGGMDRTAAARPETAMTDSTYRVVRPADSLMSHDVRVIRPGQPTPDGFEVINWAEPDNAGRAYALATGALSVIAGYWHDRAIRLQSKLDECTCDTCDT